MLSTSTLRRIVLYAHRLRSDWRWSGDFSTFRAVRDPAKDVGDLAIRCPWASPTRSVRVKVRSGTTDVEIARAILSETSEYRIPIDFAPATIVDVGANIGMAALYFGTLYPAARLFCFEPEPENLELLRQNVAQLGSRVTVIGAALGATEGQATFVPSSDSANKGGGSCLSDREEGLKVPVTTLARVMAEHGVDKIDLLKLDCEGAEGSVIAGLPPSLIRQMKVIVGELHGVSDLQVLGTIWDSHHVGVSKRFDRPCFPFVAVRRGI